MNVPILDGALRLGNTLIERLFPDPSAQAAARLELAKLAATGELTEMTAKAGIVQAEAASDHWLAANWRPLTMLSFVAVMLNNYILVPYLAAFGVEGAVVIDMPAPVWDTIQVGLGGYIGARTVEKIAPSIAGALRK